jgi:hypothetical protein
VSGGRSDNSAGRLPLRRTSRGPAEHGGRCRCPCVASRGVDSTPEHCVPARPMGHQVTHGASSWAVSIPERGFLEPTVSRTLRTGFILSCLVSPSEFLRRSSRLALSGSPVLPGVPSLFATSPVRVHSARGLPGPRYVPPSGFLNLSAACSALRLCGFVAPRSHVQGSYRPGVSPGSQPCLARRQAVPPCRCHPTAHRR